MSDALLALNAGSSSLKYAFYRQEADGHWTATGRGCIEGQVPEAHLAQVLALPGRSADLRALRGVVHRVVHGGPGFSKAVRVTPEVRASLQELLPLAPLHQPPNLAGIDAITRRMPGLPQVACFDTAFHHGWAPVTELVPLPGAIRAAGIRRYGFHGLSFEYIARALHRAAPAVAAGRVGVAHLGNGASLCALRDGRSVDTSFGFTTLDGLCMGTRPGALDPGIVLYLFQQLGLSSAAVEDILYRQSGLLGISGLSADMRELLASDRPAAALAVEYFIHRAARETASLAAVLGGLDALVFTAGIGENSAEVRARIAGACSWLGIRLDATANARGGPRISAGDSPVQAWVIPTDEEAMMVHHAIAVLGLGGQVLSP